MNKNMFILERLEGKIPPFPTNYCYNCGKKTEFKKVNWVTYEIDSGRPTMKISMRCSKWNHQTNNYWLRNNKWED